MPIYSHDDELIAAGARRFAIANHWCFFRERTREGQVVGYDTSAIDVRVMDVAIPRLQAPDNCPILLDLETFDLRRRASEALPQLTRAAMRWKSTDPHRPIGFYGLLPERSFWWPVRDVLHAQQNKIPSWHANRRDLAAWRARNDNTAAHLLGLVDYLCPSVYPFNPDDDASWRVYALANIAEALRVARGKPVFPILQAAYKAGLPIPLDTWDMMLETVATFPGIAGLWIHAALPEQTDPHWREPILERM